MQHVKVFSQGSVCVHVEPLFFLTLSIKDLRLYHWWGDDLMLSWPKMPDHEVQIFFLILLPLITPIYSKYHKYMFFAYWCMLVIFVLRSLWNNVSELIKQTAPGEIWFFPSATGPGFKFTSSKVYKYNRSHRSINIIISTNEVLYWRLVLVIDPKGISCLTWPIILTFIIQHERLMHRTRRSSNEGLVWDLKNHTPI